MDEIKLPNRVVELPAFVGPTGQIDILAESLAKVPYDKLYSIAREAGLKIIYVKVRAVYEPLETPLCTHKECYRPVGQDKVCSDHSTKVTK